MITSNRRLLLVLQKPGHTGEEGEGQYERAGVRGSFCCTDSSLMAAMDSSLMAVMDSSLMAADGFLPDGC